MKTYRITFLLRSLGHCLLDRLCHRLLGRELCCLGAGLLAGLCAGLLRRPHGQRLDDLGGGRLDGVVLALDLDRGDVLLGELGLDLLSRNL